MESLNLLTTTKTVQLQMVGTSVATANNDGANCKDQRIPFATCSNKNGDADPSPNPITDAECGSSNSPPFLYRPSTANAICTSIPCDVTTIGSRDHSACCSVDVTPPIITAYNPLQAATGVSPTTTLQLTFSENVQAGQGTILIAPNFGAAVAVSVQDTSVVSFSGAVMTITPASSLVERAQYSVTFPYGNRPCA